MAFDDLVNKGKEALNSEQGKQLAGQALDGAEGFANQATGGKFEEQVAQGRDAVGGFLGQPDGHEDHQNSGEGQQDQQNQQNQ